MKHQSPLLDTLLTALAPAIWGSTYIVTTELLPADRPFIAACLRCLPAGLLLVLWCRQRPEMANWWRLMVLSALNIGVFQALLFVAAYRLPGGLAAVLGAVQPLLVMLLLWLVDQQKPVVMAAWSGLLGVAGMALLLLSPDTVWEPVGIAAAFAGACCMATGTWLAMRWRPMLKAMPLLAFTGWQLLLGGLMLLPLAIWIDPALPTLTATEWMGYSYLSIFGALIAYALWFRGINRLSPVAVSSLGLLSPLTAVALGWLLLEQHITGLSLIGLVVVLISVTTVQRLMMKPVARPMVTELKKETV